MRLFHRLEERELRGRLAKGVVCFVYRTKNGYKRKAIGTTNLNIVRRLGIDVPTPKSEVHRKNVYFDLEKRWWRSYIPNNILYIEG